jgi:hypothetical protein
MGPMLAPSRLIRYDQNALPEALRRETGHRLNSTALKMDNEKAHDSFVADNG